NRERRDLRPRRRDPDPRREACAPHRQAPAGRNRLDQYLAQDRAQLAVRRLQAVRLRARERPHHDRASHPPEAGVGRPERVHDGPVRDVNVTTGTNFSCVEAVSACTSTLMPPDATGRPDPLATLSALLRTALDFTVDLAGDAHLPR